MVVVILAEWKLNSTIENGTRSVVLLLEAGMFYN